MTQKLIGGDNPAAMDDNLRPRLNKVLEEIVDNELLRILVVDNLSAVKHVRHTITCKHCKRDGIYNLEIPDAKASMQALEILMNQTKGRPDVAKQESAEKITFVRTVHLDDE